MFHIVVFDNTNEVEVVPSSWMKNGECMWPPNKTDVAKAVKSQQDPGHGWKPHKARIIFTSYDYNEARLKLPEAVENTDLGSGGDSPIQFKRKRIRKNILFPGEEDDTDDDMNGTTKVTKSRKGLDSLPHAPKIHVQNKTPAFEPGKQNSPKIRSSCSPELFSCGHSSPELSIHPPRHTSSEVPGLRRTSSERHSPRSTSSEMHSPRRTSSEVPGLRRTSSERHSPRSTSSERHSRRTSSEMYTPRHMSSEARGLRRTSSEMHSPRQTGGEMLSPRFTSHEARAPRSTSSEMHSRRRTSSEVHTPRRNSSEVRPLMHTKRRTATSVVPSRHPESHQSSELTTSLQTSLLHNILTKQEMMMEQLRIIFKTLQGMKATDEAETGLDQNLLPLKDVDSLEMLEEQLQSNPDLQKQLVNALALKGGTDTRECVWRIMHALITNSLAKNMNMRGVNGKICFQRLQIRNVVTAAVRRNRLTSGATDQEIDATIKRWLHLAPDRDGGRKERMRRKECMEGTAI